MLIYRGSSPYRATWNFDPSPTTKFLTFNYFHGIIHQNFLHLIKNLVHLFSREQRRRVHTSTIQLTVTNHIKEGDRWPNTVCRGTTDVVVQADVLLRRTGSFDDGIFKDRDQGSSHGRRGSEAGIFNRFAHEEVQVRHV